MRRLHLVLFAALIAVGSAPLNGAAPGSVSGVVRDSSGSPQMGAVVQLLRPNLTVITSVYTNSKGRFTIPSVFPGRYAVKAMGTAYLPSLREDVHVHSSTVVNLTLNTLYEVMQWLPSEPRQRDAQRDDWKWTLRSAANRPLLRWLEDGPLVVVSDGSGSTPKLKARLVATGQEGTFGESGERLAVAVEDTPTNSRELLAQVDFDPATDAGMESMLGFRQDLGFAGSVQSVAAVAIHPEIDAAGSDGLDEAVMRSWETMNLGDEFRVEAGSTQVFARFAETSGHTLATALPFASVAWRNGDSLVSYRVATLMPPLTSGDNAQAQTWLPPLSVRNGNLVLEHGLDQEIGWDRQTDVSSVSVFVYTDRLKNPVLEAMSHPARGLSVSEPVDPQLLYDTASGLVRAAGSDFSSVGMLATFEHRLPKGNQVRFSYANGNALVMDPAAQPVKLSELIASAHPRHTQTYSISLSGTLDGTGTRWRATYRWQPDSAVTPVAAFSQNAAGPYLNLHLRQSLHLHREGAAGFEALMDLRNLLAQGYHPYLLTDGSLLVFAQQQRAFSGGLAFNF